MRRQLMFAALLLALLCVAPLAAQSNRTFVSVNGIDNAQCGFANPCRAFSGALAAVNSGGEIVALDSGGFGTVTISKSVSIVGAPGVHAAITAVSGSAITVITPSTETVVLRGLYLSGAGALKGIDFQTGGNLHIENCVIHGFQAYGIDMTASRANLYISDTVVRNVGWQADSSAAIRITPAEATLDHQSTVSIQRTRIENNSMGLRVVNGEVIARETVAAGNSVGFLAIIEDNGFDAPLLSLLNCDSFNNGIGLYTGGGDFATFYVDDSRIMANDFSFSATSGHIYSGGNNTMVDNHAGPTAFTEFYNKK